MSHRLIGLTLVLACANGLVLRAQTAARPAFEIATVKSSPPSTGDTININLGRILNGTVTLTNASLSDCIKFAYGIVSDDQLSGPDWIKSKAVRFDIVAQAPPNLPRDQLLLMLQSLLVERVNLVLHHEQKELSYLGLVAGKNGVKIQEAKPDAVLGNAAGRGRITANQMPMGTLATLLSRFERQTVIDRTGLRGSYAFKLEWTPNDNPAAPDNPSAPWLFTAVQEQLGLKLESRKGPLDVIVVDHAEKVPTEN